MTIGQRITVYRVAPVRAWFALLDLVEEDATEARIWQAIFTHPRGTLVEVAFDSDEWSRAFLVAQAAGIAAEFTPGRDPHPS